MLSTYWIFGEDAQQKQNGVCGNVHMPIGSLQGGDHQLCLLVYVHLIS